MSNFASIWHRKNILTIDFIKIIQLLAIDMHSLTHLCHSLSHSMDHCCNLMKQSTAACFASGVQSGLLCVLPSQWVIWKEKCPCSMAWMLSEFLPPRGVRLPHSSFLVLSFLSSSLLLSKGNANAVHHIPPTTTISILRVLSPVWTGCARGWRNQGRWNEWKCILWALTSIPLSLVFT